MGSGRQHRGFQPAGPRIMSISSSVASAAIQAVPKAKTRNAALDRTRTFLTLVVLLHHSVIPYTYFGHTDPKSWIGFDCVVLATDSFFMAMFFFLSGLFVWPSLARKSPQVFLARSVAPARPALRDSGAHDHTDCLLRHRAAPASRRQLRRILVEDGHGGAVAKRPDLVRLGVAGFRSYGQPAVSALIPAARSDQSHVAARLRPAGRVLPVSRGGHRRPLCSGTGLLRTERAGSSSGRSPSRPAACCCMRPTFSSGPASARRISTVEF